MKSKKPVAPETILGVRTPELRKYAKQFGKTKESAEYIKILPHKYYDENNLHGFLIANIKDYETFCRACFHKLALTKFDDLNSVLESESLEFLLWNLLDIRSIESY